MKKYSPWKDSHRILHHNISSIYCT